MSRFAWLNVKVSTRGTTQAILLFFMVFWGAMLCAEGGFLAVLFAASGVLYTLITRPAQAPTWVRLKDGLLLGAMLFPFLMPLFSWILALID